LVFTPRGFRNGEGRRIGRVNGVDTTSSSFEEEEEEEEEARGCGCGIGGQT
jgi:hypothetical protein